MAPQLWILAGPNGAGRSTLAEHFLKEETFDVFINADVIARGLSIQNNGRSEIQAGRAVLARLHTALKRGESLSYETTLSGKSWSNVIQLASQNGYEVTLCYVIVKDPSIAVERVKQRVLEGGHHIPEDTIRRRYDRSRALFFNKYSDLVDNWYFFDNTDDSALLVAYFEDQKIIVKDAGLYDYYRGL